MVDVVILSRRDHFPKRPRKALELVCPMKRDHLRWMWQCRPSTTPEVVVLMENGSPPTAVAMPSFEAVNEVVRGDRADENGSPPMGVAVPVVEAIVGEESLPPQEVAAVVLLSPDENEVKAIFLDESELKSVVPDDSEMEAVVEDDPVEMVVEGTPLGEEGDLLLPGDDDVHRRPFAEQMREEVDGMDGYYSPPKEEAFVLTLADTHTPLIDDLVVVRDHDTGMLLADQEEPLDGFIRSGRSGSNGTEVP